jgi:hypothetical protein
MRWLLFAFYLLAVPLWFSLAALTHRGGLKIPNLFRFSHKTSHWSICNLPVACKAPPSLDCCECNPFVHAGRLIKHLQNLKLVIGIRKQVVGQAINNYD